MVEIIYKNKHYKYFILAICFGLFNNSLGGINYYNAFQMLRLIPTSFQEKYSNHLLIRQIFYYFGTFIISLIYLFSQKNEYNNDSLVLIGSRKGKKRSLIFNQFHITKISVLSLLTIIFFWVLMEQTIEKYDCILSHLDFWMLELIIISYLNAKIFKNQIYSHHKFVFIFNLFPIIFKIITIILTFKENEDDKSNNKYLNNSGSKKLLYLIYWYLIPLSLFIYIPLITLRSYIYIKIKWLMDLKYISTQRLLRIYGIIGTIFYSFICLITTIFSCKDNNDKTNILDYICGIEYKGKIYFENFADYFKTTDNVKEIFFEIIVIILGTISFYYYKYYSLTIIKNLSPVHLIFLSPIYYCFFKIVLIIYNIFYKIYDKSGRFLEDPEMKYIKLKFFLDVSGDIFSFIGFLIYLEIIELNICKLDYNLRKNIMRRATEESIEICEIMEDSDEEDDK